MESLRFALHTAGRYVIKEVITSFKIFEFKSKKSTYLKICCGLALGCAFYVFFHNIFLGLGLATVGAPVTCSALSKKDGWFF